MELDFGIPRYYQTDSLVTGLDLLDQSPAKNSSKGYDMFANWLYAREQSCESNDSHIINAFKNVTVDYLRDRIGSKRYNCTFTITLDLKKKNLSDLKNDYMKQWRHIKQTMRVNMGTYNYQFYMIPELTERGIIHAHGVICFRALSYDDYEFDRVRWTRKIKLKCGKCIQWTRINDLYNSYMPTESNIMIRRKQSFNNWITNYCHKNDLRKKIGHCNMME